MAVMQQSPFLDGDGQVLANFELAKATEGFGISSVSALLPLNPSTPRQGLRDAEESKSRGLSALRARDEVVISGTAEKISTSETWRLRRSYR